MNRPIPIQSRLAAQAHRPDGGERVGQGTTEVDDDKVKRPASQYYWGDWWKDKALQSCSQPARGLWHEMNCLMHEGEPYGHLTVNRKGMTVAQLANLCRITASRCKALVDELEGAGVFSRNADGVIYSRRMVRDERTREARAEAGRLNGVKGKEFGAMGAEHGVKGGRPKREENPGETPPTEPGGKPPQNPLPSSSSSSSSAPSVLNTSEASPLHPPASPAGELPGIDPKPEPRLPDCPHAQLLALYAKHLPQLVQPRVWDGARAEAMRARWRQCSRPTAFGKGYRTTEEGVAFWDRFFGFVASCPALRDGITTNGRTPWFADLPWLMKAENFAKVIEGKYAT